jgi:hypothetical protein
MKYKKHIYHIIPDYLINDGLKFKVTEILKLWGLLDKRKFLFIFQDFNN